MYQNFSFTLIATIYINFNFVIYVQKVYIYINVTKQGKRISIG